MPDETFDVIVIGAGPTGENVAQRTARAGLSTVVVESELVGGECSYWACMPSKALLRPIDVVTAARRVQGVRVDAVALDVDGVLKRRDSFASEWDDAGQVRWLDGEGIALRRGIGRIVAERRVGIETDGHVHEIAASHAVVVCSGSRAALPPIDGLDGVGAWTSREATGAKTIPDRLIVIGGGVVGCEMATAFQGLGSQVTMLVRDAALLPRNEPVAGELVADALREAGVVLLTEVTTVGAMRDAQGVHVTLADGRTVDGDEVLVATGRKPNTDDLGLQWVGLDQGPPLRTDDAGVVAGVDGEWLWAAGDVTQWPRLTHIGKYHARACGEAIVARSRGEALDPSPWSAQRATAMHAAVPQVVFTDPQVAAVGITAAEAADQQLAVRVIDLDLSAVAGASLQGSGPTGHVRMVVDTEREVVLGMTLVGQEIGELLHAATVAVVGEVPLRRLWHAVPSYPTVSELWLRLLEAYGL
jgi:dihydrolipoamide dehydrogenase